jgi:hypothetical protein
MTTKNITTEKREYVEPNIIRVELDNEISLDLESTLPDGEPFGDPWLSNNQFNNNSPMKG